MCRGRARQVLGCCMNNKRCLDVSRFAFSAFQPGKLFGINRLPGDTQIAEGAFRFLCGLFSCRAIDTTASTKALRETVGRCSRSVRSGIEHCSFEKQKKTVVHDTQGSARACFLVDGGRQSTHKYFEQINIKYVPCSETPPTNQNQCSILWFMGSKCLHVRFIVITHP